MKIYYLTFMILFSTSCYSQNSCPGLDSIKYGGRWYHTVQIGSHCWLKENLSVGTIINVAKQQKNNGIIEKYCWLADSDDFAKIGGLYQWNEATQYSKKRAKVQGICPKGWHIPSSQEIDTLIKPVNNDGKALTAKSGGTNTSGFSAIGSVFREGDNGKATFLSNNFDFGYFWSATSMDAELAFYFCLRSSGDNGSGPVRLARQLIMDKNEGLPIRCLKDNY